MASPNLLGEQPKKQGRAEDSLAAKHLEQLAKAVLNGDDVYAEKLAMAIAERYGF
jgi:hypothetical protein